MSDTVVAADKLRQFIERIENLEEEKSSISDDIKDVYTVAKADGFDPKAMRTVVRLRAMNKEDRQHMEAILDTYKAALGLID